MNWLALDGLGTARQGWRGLFTAGWFLTRNHFGGNTKWRGSKWCGQARTGKAITGRESSGWAGHGKD